MFMKGFSAILGHEAHPKHAPDPVRGLTEHSLVNLGVAGLAAGNPATRSKMLPGVELKSSILTSFSGFLGRKARVARPAGSFPAPR